jgi:transposase
VGSIVALTFASAIDDPGRFKSSKAVGALFGLTPKKCQSGETDVTGRISKIGDAGQRQFVRLPGCQGEADRTPGGVGDHTGLATEAATRAANTLVTLR